MDFEDFKRPSFIITFIIAVISVLLSIYFYNVGKQEREPIFTITTNPINIFNSANSSPSLKLIDRDSNIIKNDVYLIEFVIWNRGNLKIDPIDVRDSIKIKIKNSIKIIDYNIVQTNSNYSNFSLNYSTTDTIKNTLTLHWLYFDPDNAFKIKVVYIGDSKPEIEILGSILSVNSIKIVDYEKLKKISKLYLITSVAAPVVFVIASVYFFRKFKKKNIIPSNQIIILNIFNIVFLLIVLFIVFSKYFSKSIPL